MKYGIFLIRILPWMLVSILLSISVDIAYHLIGTEQQVCAREGAILVVAHNWANGMSPYNPDTLPENLWVYGPAHPWVVKSIWGAGVKFSQIRLMNFWLLVVASVGIGWALRRNRVEYQYVVLLPILALSTWLVSTSMSAFCDAGGLACFVWAVALCQKESTWQSKLAACLLVTVGTFYKPYFLWAGPLISIAIFMNENIRAAVKWTVIWVSIVLAAASLFQIYNPSFFNLTIQLHQYWTSISLSRLTGQSIDWSLRNAGTVLLALITIGSFLVNRKYRRLGNWVPDAVTTQSLMTILILLTKLGLHSGAYLTYYLHLLTPTTLIWLGTRKASTYDRKLRYGATVVNAVALIGFLPFPSNAFIKYDPAIEVFLTQNHGSLVSFELIPLADQYELVLPDNGQSEYLAFPKKGSSLDFNAEDQLTAGTAWREWREYKWFTEVRSNIRDKAYPAIIISPIQMLQWPWRNWIRDIKENYRIVQMVPMDYYMVEWIHPNQFGKRNALFFYIYVPIPDESGRKQSE